MNYFLIESGEYSYREEEGIIKTTADKETVIACLSLWSKDIINDLKKAGYPESEWIDFTAFINLDDDVPRRKGGA